MKILVTGAKGQLGQDVVYQCKESGYDVLGCSREQLDVTDQEQCQRTVQSYQPDAIIHCAAYTAVDRAEMEVEQAFRINAVGTRNIAVEAEKVKARFIYISTDYVFDGQHARPYLEYDTPSPQSVYGRTKYAGERLVESLCSRYFIVRTSWVFGIHGSNFVKTMLKLANERLSLKVVQDQVGSPTYTEDLAAFLIQLVATERYGIYHASNTGVCSWYEFAQIIFEEFQVDVEVLPCSTEEFPRPAPRPRYSVLEPLSLRCNGFEALPHWRDALRRFKASWVNTNTNG